MTDAGWGLHTRMLRASSRASRVPCRSPAINGTRGSSEEVSGAGYGCRSARARAAGGFLRASANFRSSAVNAASSLKDSAEPTPTFREQRDAWESFIANTPVKRAASRHPLREFLDAGLVLPPGAGDPGPDVGRRERQRRVARRAVGLDGSGGARSRVQRAPLRRPWPAVSALRAWGALPAGLGARAHPGLRVRRGTRRRRRGPHRRLRHQPGQLLGRAGHRFRAPLRRGHHRPVSSTSRPRGRRNCRRALRKCWTRARTRSSTRK